MEPKNESNKVAHLRRVGTIQVGQLPPSILNSIEKYITWYATGLIGVSGKSHRQTAELIGSGTFVKYENLYGILTAGHIIKKGLKNNISGFENLGLTIAPYAHHFAVPISELKFIEIYKQGRRGPDIGVILLPSTCIGKIESLKSFWNLSTNRDFALDNIIGFENFVAVLGGCPSEDAREVEPESGFGKSIRFGGIAGLTGIDRYDQRGNHDYFEVGAAYDTESSSPQEFNGMSGAGLWKATIEKLDDGTLINRDPFLAGMVYYQYPTIQGQKTIVCHGTKSIYNVILDKLKDFKSPPL